MKKALTILLFLYNISIFAQKKQKETVLSQQIIAQPPAEIKPKMQADAWIVAGKVEFLNHKGIQAIKIESVSDTDQVVLRNILFENGTIEYDIEPYASSSIYFRRNNYREQEIFYLRERFNQPLYNDAIQYCPIIDGVIMWDVFDHFQAPALIKPNEWNHIKLVVSGFQMRVYVNDMNKPALEVPRLEGSQKTGSIAFDGNCIVANLVIKPNQTEGLAAYEGTDLTNHDANYLRKWQLSNPIKLPIGTEPYFRKLPENDSIFTQRIEAERHGLLNLTRQFGKNKEREMVWLKTKLNSETAQQKILSLGFSEEVWVFVNKQFCYSDKNLYRTTNVRKYPDGRLSTQNAAFPIQLKKGENEILIAIANNFYAWGLVARLMDLEGIQISFHAEPFRSDTLTLFDQSRNRKIPVAYFQPQSKKSKVVIFSHGYGQNKGGDYLAYSYLNEFLASKGYFVASIQHELSTDSLLPLTGNPQIVRRPFWERGTDNILFVINELKKTNPELDFKHITLIGHSNGGDMTALFPQKYPNIVDKTITLDNRRMALTRTKNPRVYSLRSSDQPADEGVLPTDEETKKFGMKIIKLPNTTHNEMDDNANEEQRNEIRNYVLSFLQNI